MNTSLSSGGETSAFRSRLNTGVITTHGQTLLPSYAAKSTAESGDAVVLYDFQTALSGLIDKFSQEKGVLTFYGVRNSESVRRSKYRDIEHSPKIAKQVVASPLLAGMIWIYGCTC